MRVNPCLYIWGQVLERDFLQINSGLKNTNAVEFTKEFCKQKFHR